MLDTAWPGSEESSNFLRPIDSLRLLYSGNSSQTSSVPTEQLVAIPFRKQQGFLQGVSNLTLATKGFFIPIRGYENMLRSF